MMASSRCSKYDVLSRCHSSQCILAVDTSDSSATFSSDGTSYAATYRPAATLHSSSKLSHLLIIIRLRITEALRSRSRRHKEKQSARKWSRMEPSDESWQLPAADNMSSSSSDSEFDDTEADGVVTVHVRERCSIVPFPPQEVSLGQQRMLSCHHVI